MSKETLGVITLQYPDLWDGSLKILASTHDRKALLTFREAVLTEARLKLINFPDDEVPFPDTIYSWLNPEPVETGSWQRSGEISFEKLIR